MKRLSDKQETMIMIIVAAILGIGFLWYVFVYFIWPIIKKMFL